jgi:thymidylate synthase (FAD)
MRRSESFEAGLERVRGLVEVLDHMGTDLTIVDAARESFHKQSKFVAEPDGHQRLAKADAKLIEYLAKNKHWSPASHTAVTFRIKMPIYVARQWMKSSVGFCLTGDTEVTFVKALTKQGGGKTSNGVVTMKLKDIYDLYHGGRPSWSAVEASKIQEVSDLLATGLSLRKASAKVGIDRNTYRKRMSGEVTGRLPWKAHVKHWYLRVLNEETLKFTLGHISDVMYQGVQPVYTVTLGDGKTITATKNHKFYTDRGWQSLAEAVDLKCNPDGSVLKFSEAKFTTNGKLYGGYETYRQESWMREQRYVLNHTLTQIAEAAGASYHTIRKWLKVHKMQFDPLANFPSVRGEPPWNKGVTGYQLRSRTPEERRQISQRQKGAGSSFWRGGAPEDRTRISAWTAQMAPGVHAKYGYRCAKCQSNEKLTVHHIVPVTALPEWAYNTTNLVTLCATCHRTVHNSPESEVAFMLSDVFRNTPVVEPLVARRSKIKKPEATEPQPKPQAYTLSGHFVDVVSVEFSGYQDTYDLAVEGPWHNFVANGIVTHNSVNEISRRYVDEPPEFEFGVPWRKRPDKSIKQGSGEEFNEAFQEAYSAAYLDFIRRAEHLYNYYIDGGVAPEQARKILPVSHYTEFWQTGNLESFARLYKLRVDSHAQEETQQYAVVIGEHMARLFPEAWPIWIRDFKGEEIAKLKEQMAEQERSFLRRIAELEADLEYTRSGRSHSEMVRFLS